MKEIYNLNYYQLLNWSLKAGTKNIICNIPAGFGKTFNLGKILMDSRKSINVIYFDNSKTKTNELGILDIDTSIRNLVDKIHYLQKNYYDYSDFQIIEEYEDKSILIKNKDAQIRIVSVDLLELDQYKNLEYEFLMLDDCISYVLPNTIRINRKISMITMNDYSKILRRMYPNSFVIEKDIFNKDFEIFMDSQFKEYIEYFKLNKPDIYYNCYEILSVPKL